MAGKTTKTVKAKSKTEALAAELKTLIPRLDEEGLTYLIEQARIHIYNMSVDEYNASVIKAAAAESAAEKAAGTKAARKARAEASRLGLRSSDNKKVFYLVYKNNDMMFNSQEMLALAKIASAKLSEAERREGLYRWFDRERRDVFQYVPFKSKQSELLGELIKLLNKNFKVKYS